MEAATKAGSRPKPPDYDDAWYEEADGQFYNQYDWYQDEHGEWQYDYRLEEQGLVQNELGEWVQAEVNVSPTVGQEGDKDRKNDLANNFRTKDDTSFATTNVSVTSSTTDKKNAQGLSGSSGPRVKPPDYEEAWYEEADGQFYNQYDWYQDENGEWQYDYRLEEQGLVQNELGEWVTEDEIRQPSSLGHGPSHLSNTDKQKPKVPSPTERSKPMPLPASNLSKTSSSAMFKGLSNFGNGLVGAATSAAKEAASSAALAVDSIADVADAAMEAMPDIELPQAGLVAKATGSTMPQASSVSTTAFDNVEISSSGEKKIKKEAVVQQRSSDGFSQLFSSSSPAVSKTKETAASLSTVKSTLPPRPADYDDFWYQADNGNWYNEYDDMGYEFADEEILVVEEQEAILTTEVLADVKRPNDDQLQKPQQKKVLARDEILSTKPETQKTSVTSKSAKKPPRPDDYDDFWYQDDAGQWKNEYDDLGYNFEDEEDDEFYTEEELAKEEAELFREKDEKEQQQKVLPTCNSIDKKSEGDLIKSSVPKAIMPTMQPMVEKKKPADYEDHWFQDYDGNWYNEYDQLEEEKAIPQMPTANTLLSDADSQVSSSAAIAKKEKKTVSFDKDDIQEHIVTGPVGGRTTWRNPKDRWQWAFTRIIQVGGGLQVEIRKEIAKEENSSYVIIKHLSLNFLYKGV
jgi:hypothetical protein